MESNVWSTLISIQAQFEKMLDSTGIEINERGMERFNKPGWVNKVWTSESYRRAHLDVVDARESKGLWMMHCCVFPHTHNPAPIFGFDVVAGRNKITGCFYDFSPSGNPQNELISWFENSVKDLAWKKTRELPPWAERIFSEHMIAASNVQSDEELTQIFNMATTGMDYYLQNVGNFNNSTKDVSALHNFYAQNQKQNPHTPKVMAALGLDEEDVAVFIDQCLFPELQIN